ncbi:MAG: thioesterase [Gammaproteobacteria bacterium]|nr:thioesterase [Gammaproteobacteria bacterium]
MNKLCKELEAEFHREVPLCREMGMKVQECDEVSITIQAPLAPNINIHGSAFAGSLFSIAALAGWGLLHMRMEREEGRAQIVMAGGQITYHLPVREGIKVISRLPETSVLDEFMETYRSAGKARISIAAEIVVEDDVVASFKGGYTVWSSEIEV